MEQARNKYPNPGEYVKFSAYWIDDYDLANWTFSWNATQNGNWVNVTTGYFNTKEGWSNTTQQIPSYTNGTYGFRFYTTDELGNENVTDIGIFEIPGYMEVRLVIPPDNTTVAQYRNFTVNTTVYCRNGSCGNISATVRYNSSSVNPDTQISTVEGDTPFYTLDPNPQNCSTNPIQKDEFCSITWNINSTDNLREWYKIGVLFESTISDSNHTENNTIEIGKVMIISVTWDETNFGVCDPNTQGNPGLLNSNNGYNVSIDPNSNDVEYLWIKGTDLDPQNISGFDSIEYKISVGNISWNDGVNDYNDLGTERLTLNYELVRQNIPSGTNVTFYYWVDIPPGTYEQNYTGMMYVMANASY